MTYEEATAWLFQQLPMFQRQGAAAYKADLGGTWLVLESLGRPDLKLDHVIHVAGTNGKGSVCTAVANALVDGGLRVGLFTSPHLLDFRERMRVNGAMPSREWVVQFVTGNRAGLENFPSPPSFFEWTFGMALSWFVEEEVDIVVLETGMGGRLDSTNIFPNPLVTAITNIGLDHQQFLGGDIRSIAMEKAGIIKEGRPVVMGRMRPEAQSVILERAMKMGSECHYAPQEFLDTDPTTCGPHWGENRATAWKILEVLSQETGWRHLQVPAVQGLTKRGHMARWSWLPETPKGAKVLCDCAHNMDGLSRTLDGVSDISYKRKLIVFGAVADKDLTEVWTLLDSSDVYFWCAADIPRALPAHALKEKAESAGFQGQDFSSVASAYYAAREMAKEGDLVLIVGSIFVAAEVLAWHQNNGFPDITAGC